MRRAAADGRERARAAEGGAGAAPVPQGMPLQAGLQGKGCCTPSGMTVSAAPNTIILQPLYPARPRKALSQPPVAALAAAFETSLQAPPSSSAALPSGHCLVAQNCFVVGELRGGGSEAKKGFVCLKSASNFFFWDPVITFIVFLRKTLLMWGGELGGGVGGGLSAPPPPFKQ